MVAKPGGMDASSIPPANRALQSSAAADMTQEPTKMKLLVPVGASLLFLAAELS
jgi:hypothetical protein